MTSMKNSTIYPGLAMALMLCCQQQSNAQLPPTNWKQKSTSIKNETLDVNPLRGKPPLTVTLNGPQELVSRMRQGRNTQALFDKSYSFTWGDGHTMLDPNKPQSVTHTYHKPGTYYVGATIFKPTDNDSMRSSYQGATTVVVEGSGSSAARKNTDPFAANLQLPPKYVRLEKRSKGNPNTIKLWLTVKVPPNFECCIDWGDGTIEQREAPPRTASSATQLHATTKSISHTYKKKGRYRVRLKTNNDEPSKKARDVLYYECFDISI